jgi:hypothetical protein
MYATLLLLLAGPLLAGGGRAGGAPAPGPDEEILKKAGVKADDESLLDFLRKRTLPEEDRPAVLKLVGLLGSDVFSEREDASADLVARGPAVGEILRAALASQDPEVARRAERCLAAIHEKDVPSGVPAAVVRLLAARKPAGVVAVTLAFLPFADNDSVAEEAGTLLVKLAAQGGKADPVLVAALADRAPVRRAAAGQALARAVLAEHLPAVRKLLADPDAQVRFRIAQALVYAGDAGAVAALIDTLPDLPLPLAWQAEDFLLHLAGPVSPPTVAMGNDPVSRRKCRDGWQAWWKEHQARVDLTKLEEPAKVLGHTLIVLLDLGKVMELGPDNQPRWEVQNLSFPLDVQLLGEDRVLVAEYYGNRVTERDLKGHILWQKEVVGPLVAQRLPNGNTFIATDMALFEYDKDGKEVLKIEMPGENKRVMKALKLPNGEIACLTSDARVARLDAEGKELHGFTISLGTKLFGGRIHMLPSGRVLVPHHSEEKVVEYDGQGKVVWEVSLEKPISALRLPNGNTLVTSMSPAVGAVEFDRAGNQVWQYSTTTRVTRAIRR